MLAKPQKAKLDSKLETALSEIPSVKSFIVFTTQMVGLHWHYHFGKTDAKFTSILISTGDEQKPSKFSADLSQLEICMDGKEILDLNWIVLKPRLTVVGENVLSWGTAFFFAYWRVQEMVGHVLALGLLALLIRLLTSSFKIIFICFVIFYAINYIGVGNFVPIPLIQRAVDEGSIGLSSRLSKLIGDQIIVVKANLGQEHIFFMITFEHGRWTVENISWVLEGTYLFISMDVAISDLSVSHIELDVVNFRKPSTSSKEG
jgi:hypothetical protein